GRGGGGWGVARVSGGGGAPWAARAPPPSPPRGGAPPRARWVLRVTDPPGPPTPDGRSAVGPDPPAGWKTTTAPGVGLLLKNTCPRTGWSAGRPGPHDRFSTPARASARAPAGGRGRRRRFAAGPQEGAGGVASRVAAVD